MKEIEAERKVKTDYIIAKPQMAKYIEISAEIYTIYLQYVSADDIHVYSIDEVFIDATDYLELYHMTTHDLAKEMIRSVLDKTGITATAGIGNNLYLSKIAMDIVAKHVPADRDGVRIAELDVMSYRRLLWDHKPLTDFWQIGHGTVKSLERIGISTMGDIARVYLYNEDILYKTFGVNAELLIDHAWGYEPVTIADIKSYQPETNSLSSGQVLPCPYDTAKARVVVREMADQLALDLTVKGMVTDSLTLDIRYDKSSLDSGDYSGPVKADFYGRLVPRPAHGTAKTGEKTDSAEKIRAAVMSLYDKIICSGLQVRRITLSANRITEKENGYEQLSLFTNPKTQEKERKMQEAMLAIRQKFGNNAILKGTNLEDGATGKERNTQIGGHHA